MMSGKLYGCVLTTVWLLAMVAISGAQRVDDILQGPDNSLCFVGTSAIFTCVSSLGNCVNMTWLQEDQFSITDWSQIHPSATNRFKMENSTLGCKLTLTNLQRADSGKFKCVYKNSAKAAVLRVFDVTRTPLRGPENKFGYLDSNVDFICVSPVKSCLGMKWHQNRAGPEGETIICNSSTGHCDTDKHIVTRSAGGCQLTVQRLEYRDAGAVICEVWISQRLYRRTAALLVFNTTDNPLTQPTNYLAYFGTNATFTCVSPLGSCADMIWYRYTIRSGYANWYQLNYAVHPRPTQKYIVENIPSRCRLTVTKVNRTDSGPYQCRFMTHFEATAQLYAIDQRQQEKPLTGMSDGAGVVGSNITFTCISPLKNCLEMIWSKRINKRRTVDIFNTYKGIYPSDKYIVENSTVGCLLTVKHIQLNDAANYTCKIMISDTVYTESAQLYAFSAEVNQLKKLVNSLTFADTDAVFTCVSPVGNCVNITWFHYFGNLPFQRYSWWQIEPKLHTRSYNEENVNFGCKLTVKNVQASKAGLYKCEFLNTFKRTAELILIDLDYQNVNHLTGPSDVFSYLGLNVTFTCDSPLRTCDSMNWYKSKRGTKRITIYSDDNGIYLRRKYVVENSTVGCRLTVINVNLNDASDFICEILISQRSYNGTAELFVQNTTENPLKGPKHSLTFIGANATFICTSPLRNCDNITWYKYNITWQPVLQLDGRQPEFKYLVENIPLGCKLTLTAVNLEDSGLYKCQFTNYFAATAELFAIDGKHREKALTVLSDGVAYVGSNISFTCVSPLKDCVEIVWYMHTPGENSSVIIFSRNDGIYLSDKYIVENSTMGCQLTITRVELSDASKYHCEIEISSKGYDEHVPLYTFNPVDNVDLPLKRPDSLLNIFGTNATFKCVSPLKSCVDMTWQRGLGRSGLQINYTAYPSFRDKYIVENFPLGCQLTVANVQLADATTYQCIFRKSISRTADLFAISRTRGNPLRGPRDLAVFVGFDANFTCTTPLRNCTLMSWYKHKRGPDQLTIYDLEKGIYLRDKYVVESVSRRCQLTIKNVERNDNSSYFCEVVISQRSHQSETKVSVNVSGELNHGCNPSDADLAVLNEHYLRSRHFRYAYVSSVQDAHEETVYHFPLSIVYRTFLNATIHAPFSMVTSENLDQTDLPSLNVIISARIPEVTGPSTPIQKAQIHNMSSGQTDFCHQENVTEIVTYLLDIGAYNLTVDVLASCQFRSGSPPQGTVCSVNRPGKPFLQLRLPADMGEATTTTTTTTTTTNEPSTPDPGLPNDYPESNETQRVVAGLCTKSGLALTILYVERAYIDDHTRWMFYNAIQGDQRTTSATYVISPDLKSDDRIFNASIYTPISITTTGNLSQSDLPPLNITVSVRTSDADSRVKFTTVYSWSFAGTEFCHQGTLTQVLPGMLGTDIRNLTVHVTTSCGFRSSAQQGVDCSVDHPQNPFLAVYYWSNTTLSFPGGPN